MEHLTKARKPPPIINEREYWDQYIEAYQAVLRKCSTKTGAVARGQFE